jgi:tetratricopeptide (TPR) repeat protein
MVGRSRAPLAVAATIVTCAIVAAAAWPHYVAQTSDAAAAAALPTMAPVVADYRDRDKLVAFWERATDEHHRGDMISPRVLAEQYLQRYRERMDIDDVLRAEKAARLALAAQPVGNLPAELELASIDLTLHRFHDAIAVTKHVESYDGGDPSMSVREASLDLEVGDYPRAARLLGSVPEKARDDAWRVVDSRLLELNGHLADARELLAVASAYQNSNFDAPAQSRAWYFFRAGEMAFEAGDNDVAIGDERQALAIFPRYADAGRDLARFECALHDWKQCLADAGASAAVVPYPETLGYMVDAQHALGDDGAARQTDDLIRAEAKLGDAQHVTDRLLALYEADHHEATQTAYAIARGELAARDDVFTDDTLAWAAAMDGRWSEARLASLRARRLHTENSLIDYHAAVIALHTGHRDEAKALFERALARNPAFHQAFADDARAQLARLG